MVNNLTILIHIALLFVGKVVAGMEVVNAINKVPRGKHNTTCVVNYPDSGSVCYGFIVHSHTHSFIAHYHTIADRNDKPNTPVVVNSVTVNA